MSRPIRVPVVPGSPEWRALRRTGVGASDIPIITGDARFGDVVSLYQDKLGYAAPMVETDFMASGSWLEDLIARWYAAKKGRKVRRLNALLRNRERPWMLATPDRSVPGRGLLEVKVTDQPGDRWGKPGTDAVPDDVLEQVTWQAAVADVEVVDIAVFFTRTRRREVYTVGRDPAVVDELVEYGAGFWQCVETRTPPEPAGRPMRSLLRADEIEADAELTQLTRLALALRAEIAEAAETQEQVDAQIKARLDTVGGARGDGFRIHYRYSADSKRTKWEQVAAEYRRLLSETIPWADQAEALDRIERDLTDIRPGARPLLIKTPKSREITHAA
jgi:putative phage-type endonuclease